MELSVGRGSSQEMPRPPPRQRHWHHSHHHHGCHHHRCYTTTTSATIKNMYPLGTTMRPGLAVKLTDVQIFCVRFETILLQLFKWFYYNLLRGLYAFCHILDASSHLYERVGPSVRQSVHHTFVKIAEKCAFLHESLLHPIRNVEK